MIKKIIEYYYESVMYVKFLNDHQTINDRPTTTLEYIEAILYFPYVTYHNERKDRKKD